MLTVDVKVVYVIHIRKHPETTGDKTGQHVHKPLPRLIVTHVTAEKKKNTASSPMKSEYTLLSKNNKKMPTHMQKQEQEILRQNGGSIVIYPKKKISCLSRVIEDFPIVPM